MSYSLVLNDGDSKSLRNKWKVGGDVHVNSSFRSCLHVSSSFL